MWVILVGLTFLGFISNYPGLVTAALWTLPLCAGLVWTRGGSPILFACCAVQWLQAVAATFYCALNGTTLEAMLEAPEVEKSSWLSIAGVLCLALGMRVGSRSGRESPVSVDAMEREAEGLDTVRIAQLWVASLFVGLVAQGVGWRIAGLHQFVVPFYILKWVFFFLLAYRVLLTDTGYGLLLGAMALDFVNGFLGWYSSYKEGLIMFLVAALAVRRSMNIRLKAGVIAVIALGVITSIFWASIKQDYRLYMAGGKKGSHGRVVRSISGRMQWLSERALSMDGEKLEHGMELLVERVQYVSLFGMTLAHVPNFVPHSQGELWYGAVTHVFMPRFLFPDKARLDDSDRTRRFTGINFSGKESGTSIGIGYMAESYVDFGIPGMFMPIFLLGAGMGLIYRRMLCTNRSPVLGMAIATAILFSLLHAFAMSNAKIVGSVVVLCLAYWLLNRAFGGTVMRWLTRSFLR